jgi:hypothetical protein
MFLRMFLLYNCFEFIFTQDTISVINSLPTQQTQESLVYDAYNVDQNYNYQMMATPNGSLYNGTSTCVPVKDLITYNHTAPTIYRLDNPRFMSPENFCYGMLSYNISRNDFFDIVNKNLKAWQNYRNLLGFYRLYYVTTAAGGIDDACVGYMRNIVCYAEFPACYDNGDTTWKAAPTCWQYCDLYQTRCQNVL